MSLCKPKQGGQGRGNRAEISSHFERNISGGASSVPSHGLNKSLRAATFAYIDEDGRKVLQGHPSACAATSDTDDDTRGADPCTEASGNRREWRRRLVHAVPRMRVRCDRGG